MVSHQDQTIIAQCTPQGSGAIALLRLSGNDALIIAGKISKLPGNKKITELQTHTVNYGWAIDAFGKTIDQVMFIVMQAPKTFTGENVVEITCHNNPFIIQEIIQSSIQAGARIAQKGEFAKRAFLNGKIDLVQAEAINELIHSHTQQALKKSLSQLEGSFSSWIEKIESKLVKCLALSEASFEFIDEEMEFGPQILQEIEEQISNIESIKKTFNQQQQIKEGIRIALIGSVNAGKSSLFNTLLNKERAIVTNIAGTTRDSIEAGIYKKDHYLTLVDTAGLRQTDDIVEQEGIRRSFAEAQKADIIILVCDGSRILSEQEEQIYTELMQNHTKKIICVINKIDENQEIQKLDFIENSLKISTKTKENISILENIIDEKIKNLIESSESPFLLNQRQHNLLVSLEKKLNEIKEMLQGAIEYEILSIHINEALQSISELSGKAVSERAMDAVFKEFCVGK